jgi:hypothetical protein
MNQEEIDREFTEVRERLSIILKLLQERNEDQRWGWNVKKKVKWPIMHLSMNKLMHRLNASWKEEKLRGQ